jgi:hypothetical protein
MGARLRGLVGKDEVESRHLARHETWSNDQLKARVMEKEETGEETEEREER